MNKKLTLFCIAMMALFMLLTPHAEAKEAGDTPEQMLLKALINSNQAKNMECDINASVLTRIQGIPAEIALKAKGTFLQRPLKAKMLATISISGQQPIDFDFYIMLKDDKPISYLNQKGNWLKYEITDPEIVQLCKNPNEGLERSLTSLISAKFAGEEVIRKQKAKKIEIVADVAALAAESAGTGKDAQALDKYIPKKGEISYTVWVAEGNLVKMAMDLTPYLKSIAAAIKEDDTATREMKRAAQIYDNVTITLEAVYYNYNKAKKFDIPAAALKAPEAYLKLK